MKYIIEDRIIFRPDDGAFWMTERECEKIILPPIVARLMALLLEEQGKVLTRDEIMDRIWTVHGLEPSGNSLNQYISNIRRNFQNVGLGDEVIKTIPRIGFVLSNEIKIKKDIQIELLPDPATEIPHLEKVHTNSSSSATYKFLYFILFSLVLIVIVSTPFIIQSGVNLVNNNKITTVPMSIGTINQCNVKTIKMDNANHHPELRLLAQRILDNNNIHCANDETVILFAQNSVMHNQPGRVFISVCREGDRKLSSCKSLSFNGWVQ